MTLRSLLVLLTTVAALSAGCSVASANSNAASTQAYVQANYALVRAARSHLATSEAAPRRILAQVRAECPQAANSSPQDPESTELSNEIIGAMVLGAARPDIPAIKTYLRSVSHLRWSNGALTRAIHAYTSKLRTLLALSAPALCSDVRAWASSGFKALPSTTVAFDAKFVPAWVALGELPKSLSAYESSSEKALARLSNHAEELITEAEAREVETWGSIMDELVLEP